MAPDKGRELSKVINRAGVGAMDCGQAIFLALMITPTLVWLSLYVTARAARGGGRERGAMKRYAHLARIADAYHRCLETGNEWASRHREMLEAEVRNGPSGSGIDNGTRMDLDLSNGETLVFYTAFHHMNEVGSYDGWTNHTVTVRPSLQFGCSVHISGHNRNEIKDYLHQMYSTWLEETPGGTV